MGKYRILVEMSELLENYVEADCQKEAEEKARLLDEADYSPIENSGDFKIIDVEEDNT